jgi:hypothetical protein
MIPALPITSHQESFEFRKSLNHQLNQHVHIPNPVVPQWSFEFSSESLSALLVPNPLYARNSDILFLVIRDDYECALLSARGGSFRVGKVSCLESCKGAVLQVILQRLADDSPIGGTFYVLDVLSYNGKPLSEPSEKRYLISQAISSMFSFPPRYKFSLCSRVSIKQAKSINDFALPVYLIKDV